MASGYLLPKRSESEVGLYFSCNASNSSRCACGFFLTIAAATADFPVALINDYCNQKLIDGFENIESHHFILTAKTEIQHQRINNQENRDIDLAVTYMPEATQYLSNHYYDASIIDTSNMSIDSVAKEIIESITR